jgi:signal transduction histidine kinase
MSLQIAPAPTTKPTAPASTILQGRLLILARAVWMLVALLAVVLFVVTIAFRWSELSASAAGMRPGAAQLGVSTVYLIAIDVALRLSFFAIGALIFWHKSDEWIALFVSLILVTIGATPDNATIAVLAPVWRMLSMFLGDFGWQAIWLLLYVFPDGRFVPRWTRLLMAFFFVGQGYQLLVDIFPNLSFSDVAWLQLLDSVATVLLLGSCVFAQIYRYRRVSSPVQRQQTKWFVFGVTIALSAAVLINNVLSELVPALKQPGSLPNLVAQTLSVGALFLIPLSIGIAILRYRLWDIDVIIIRTLVYGALTASVIGIYALTIGYLSLLFQGRGSPIIALLATGVVAVLFQPLREWLQRAVNRLVYGERDDPYMVISRLGQRLEATLAPDAALTTIVETVKEALKLPYVAVRLKHDDDFRIAAAAGTAQDDLVRLPLIYADETIGELVVAPRTLGEAFTPADRRLLDDLARQAGVAIHAVRLTADLARSRLRIVTEREEARRRLGSDLHDGLGHRLASLLRKAEIAANLVDRDPAKAKAQLDGIRQQTKAAIDVVRGLAHTLHPPELEVLGLVGALRERAEGYTMAGENGLRISIAASDLLPALPAAVEVAAYYIAQEALTNVQRHAGAQCCYLRLALVARTSGDDPVLTALDAPVLEVEIIDDGRGLAGDGRSSGGLGLASMQERAAEVGGTCVIERVATGGTRVYARLPCPTTR